jgi:EmrB/QacA subfamily drug resistance transporter
MSTPSAARSQAGGGPAAARAAEATSPADPRRWWVLAIIGIAQLMLVLDSTIVNIALPSAQRALDFADSDRVWIVTAYALAFGSFLLLGGRLGDMFGRKRTFIAGLAGFALASAAGGAAPDFAVLVSARAVQGLFAALLAPSALTLLATTFTDAKERGRAFAVYGAVAGGGGSVGLLLGGALTSYASWRWCLYVNLIFAAVAAAGGLLLLSNPPRQSRPVIDVPGVVLASAGLFALVFGFSRAQTDSWGSSVTLAWLAAGVALLAGFVLVQRRVEHPLLPLRVVLDRNRAGAYAAIGLTFIAVFALFFFLTFYLQGVRGYSPVKTGLAFLPLPLALVVSSGISTVRLFPRLGPRRLIVPGLLVAAVGMVLLSRLGIDSSYAAHVLPALVITGLGFGAVVPPALSTATQGVEFRDAGVASGLANTMQQVGGSIGTSLLTAIAAQAAARSLGSRPAPSVAAVAQATIHGYSVGFQVAAIIFLGAAVICALLLRPRADKPLSPQPDTAAAS